MRNNTETPIFRTLILALPDPPSDRLRHHLRQFVKGLWPEMPDIILLPFTTSSPIPLSGSLRHFCTDKRLRLRETMLISDTQPYLTAARELGMACAGLQRPDTPYLSAPYLFTDFSDDLPAYLYQAYCRFHDLPMTIARTPRLLIRETCLSDLAGLTDLYQRNPRDSDTPPLCFFPPDNQETFLRSYIRTMYAFYGFGMYTVIRRTDGALIGHCGFDLVSNQISDHTENTMDGIPALGYLIAPAFRRQGYGPEACRACLAHLAATTACRLVVCKIHKNNRSSLTLAQKLGFRPVCDTISIRTALAVKKDNSPAIIKTKKAEDSDFIILCLKINAV